MKLLQILTQLFRGPPGPPGRPGLNGMRGPRGPEGPPGQSWSRDTEIVQLPLGVVLVAPDYGNVGRLPYIQESIEQSQKFWLRLGVNLQVTFKALQSDLPPGRDALDVLRLHHWQGTGYSPTVYIWGDAERVGAAGTYLGETYGNGVITAAGLAFGPDRKSLLWRIICHEMGHALFGTVEHQAGTFMAAELEMGEMLVTPEQRAKLREAAYRLGGL